jgi:DNA-binding response OmpR family regulator
MAILVFENNAILASDIQKNLIAEGYEVLLIREPNEVPEEKEFWKKIGLIVLDLMMGDADLPDDWKKESQNGLTTGYVVYKNMCPDKNIPVLVLTGLKDEKDLEEVEKGINNCILLKKPIDYDEFLGKVRRLLKK